MPTALELAALDDLIAGRGVRRGRHQIPGELADTFRERLAALGYAGTRVGDVDIEVGVRVPAWVFRPPVADFGWVFWEIFTEKKRRKLFGCDVKNDKGDWAIQLAPQSPETIFANAAEAQRYDASRPVGIW